MSEHIHQDELEERDDVVDSSGDDDDQEAKPEPDPGEPWAKTSSGNADEVTS